MLRVVYGHKVGVSLAAALALATAWYAAAKSKKAARVKGMPGKVAVITGASSGIGKALAARLAERGFKLTLAARGAEALAGVAESVGGAHVVPTDVTDPAACQALIAAAVAHHGRIDLLVSCAGIGHHGLCTDDDIAMQRKLIEVNHFGTVHCVKAALPHLIKAGGELLVVGSLSGEVGLPMRSAYCASKFAIAGWLDAVRIEMKMQKIPLQITVASPSSVDTPFRTHNIGPRPKMSADKCADLIIAGWEAGQDKIFVPAKVGLLTIAPQWVCDFMIQKDQKKLFSALLEASHGSSD